MNDYFLALGQQSLANHMNIEPHLSIDNIIVKYKNHNSIKNVKRNLKDKTRFDFQPISESCTKHVLATFNIRKSHGHDAINVKFLKIIAKPLSDIFNQCILQGVCPVSLKKAIVAPVCEKHGPFNKEDYKVLASLSKVFDKAVEISYLLFLQSHF